MPNKPPEPSRTPCQVCGSLYPNAACSVCVAEQTAREIASLPDLAELTED